MSYTINTDGSIRECNYEVEPRYGCYATPKEAVDNFVISQACNLNTYLQAIREYMNVIKQGNDRVKLAKEELKKYDAGKL